MVKPAKSSVSGKTGFSAYAELTEKIYAATLDAQSYDQMEKCWLDIYDAHGQVADMEAFQQIVNDVSIHAKRAIEISDQFADTNSGKKNALDEFALPAFAIDKAGKILTANAKAQSILKQRQWHTLTDIGFGYDETADIETFFRAASNKAPPVPSLTVTLGDEMFFLDTMPQRLIEKLSDTTPDQYIVRISQMSWDESFNEELLRQFQITRAEAAVLQLLVHGKQPAEIATERGTSVRTVRTQLKSIQSKALQPSQAKLVRWAMIMSLVHRDRQTAEITDIAQTKTCKPGKHHNTPDWDPGTRRTVKLPSGIHVDLCTFGNRNGRVVLHLHPLMYAPVPSDELIPDARKNDGYYVVQPIRPGYGYSTPLPAGQDRLTGVVDFYRQVLDFLNIETCCLMILGTTGSIGYRIAHDLGSRIEAIISVSTSPPLRDSRSIEVLPPYAKFTMSAAKHSPKLLEFFMATSRRREKNYAGWDTYYRRIIKDIPADVKAYENPLLRQAMFEGQKLLSQQSYRPYCEELGTFLDDWLPIAQAISQPKLIIQAEQDSTWPKSYFKEFANEINATLKWVPGGVYLFMFSHYSQVATTVDNWLKDIDEQTTPARKSA